MKLYIDAKLLLITRPLGTLKVEYLSQALDSFKGQKNNIIMPSAERIGCHAIDSIAQSQFSIACEENGRMRRNSVVEDNILRTLYSLHFMAALQLSNAN